MELQLGSSPHLSWKMMLRVGAGHKSEIEDQNLLLVF